MTISTAPSRTPAWARPATMRAAVFHGPGDIRVEDVPRPHAGPGEAVIRVTLTTICGTDVHILKGEYPVEPGLIVGHEPVGVIDELGPGVAGYEVGDRVLVGAITPCGQCHACLSGKPAQCGHGSGFEAIGGWRFGNTINGAQAEYLLVPYAQANLAKIPETPDRRAGRPAGRHRLDRLLRRRVGQGPDRRHGRRLRAGTDRPLRDGRREAHGRRARHRRRGRPEPRRDGTPDGRRHRARPRRRSTSSRRSSGSPAASAPTWRSRRSACR